MFRREAERVFGNEILFVSMRKPAALIGDGWVFVCLVGGMLSCGGGDDSNAAGVVFSAAAVAGTAGSSDHRGTAEDEEGGPVFCSDTVAGLFGVG